jgi:hypothetical protein
VGWSEEGYRNRLLRDLRLLQGLRPVVPIHRHRHYVLYLLCLDLLVRLLWFRGFRLRWLLQESRLDCISWFVVLHPLSINNVHNGGREEEGLTRFNSLEYMFQFVWKERFLCVLGTFDEPRRRIPVGRPRKVCRWALAGLYLSLYLTIPIISPIVNERFKIVTENNKSKQQQDICSA